jgi:7-carboxy-7-deazaguanine synthase
MLDIVEKFITIGGEAPLLGAPIFLIRFSNCNLNCGYCDTPYRNEINERFSLNELIEIINDTVKQFPELKILFTGGEPLLDDRQNELIEIIRQLDNVDFYIETNGSIMLENFSLNNCYYIADWKSPSSGSNDSFEMENLKKFRIDKDCIKFIIDQNDFDWVKDKIKFIQKINPFLPLFLSPEWDKLKLDELSNFIIKNKLPVKLSFQLHKFIWNDKKRGV